MLQESNAMLGTEKSWLDELARITPTLCAIYVLMFVGACGYWAASFAASIALSHCGSLLLETDLCKNQVIIAQATGGAIGGVVALVIALLQCGVIGMLRGIYLRSVREHVSLTGEDYSMSAESAVE